MLNENKVKMMTKMAIYEKHEGRSMLKTAKYYKGDFIAIGVLKGAIATTIAYIVVLAFIILSNVQTLVTDINSIDYIAVGKRVALYYGIVLLVTAIINGIYYACRYDDSRKGLKTYFSRLNKLERFYNGQKKKK